MLHTPLSACHSHSFGSPFQPLYGPSQHRNLTTGITRNRRCLCSCRRCHRHTANVPQSSKCLLHQRLRKATYILNASSYNHHRISKRSKPDGCGSPARIQSKLLAPFTAVSVIDWYVDEKCSPPEFEHSRRSPLTPKVLIQLTVVNICWFLPQWWWVSGSCVSPTVEYLIN